MLEPRNEPHQESFLKYADSPEKHTAGNHQTGGQKDFMDGFSARMEYKAHEQRTKARAADVAICSSMLLAEQSTKAMDVYDGQPAGNLLDQMTGDHLHQKSVLRQRSNSASAAGTRPAVRPRAKASVHRNDVSWLTSVEIESDVPDAHVPTLSMEELPYR